tara:strand:- start:448 stop:627 length:180 start_codon:yes stop_codon:yes gene_type:complete
MDLPIDDKEFDYIVYSLWKCRKTEKQCGDLYEKLALVKEYKDQGLPYKKILREKHGIVA